jgi:hypothetical protein
MTFLVTEAEDLLLGTSETTSEASASDWIVDSGCTAHMTNSPDLVTDVVTVTNRKVRFGGGQEFDAVGTGTLRGWTTNKDGVKTQITLQNVLIVPGLVHNLLSVKKLGRAGGHALLGRQGNNYLQLANIVIPVTEHGELYKISIDPSQEKVLTATVAKTSALWHRRLAHRNYADLVRLSKMDVGIPTQVVKKPETKCSVCEISKHHATSFKKATKGPTVPATPLRPFEKVHVDLMGRSGLHRRQNTLAIDLLHTQKVRYVISS